MLGHHQYHPTHVHSTKMAAVIGAAIVLLWAMCAPRKLSGQTGVPPGRYQIVYAESGRIMAVDRDQTTIRQMRNDGDRDVAQQAWDITPAQTPGFFYIRSAINGNALEASGSRRYTQIRAARFDGGRDQTWRIDTDSNGNSLLISQFGRPLEMPGGGQIAAFMLRPVGRRDYEGRERREREEHAFERGAPPEIIPAGTSVTIRTNEYIRSNSRDNRIYTGAVDQDILDQNGRLAIPRGSGVELMVRTDPHGDLVLDMESVNVNGQRYGIAAGAEIENHNAPGVGGNKRTGEFVGGGAVIGSILGAIAGGGKGAAIGAASGAAAGAGAQILTRGRNIQVPAESLITFRLEQPLQIAPDRGFDREGRHYHSPDNR